MKKLSPLKIHKDQKFMIFDPQIEGSFLDPPPSNGGAGSTGVATQNSLGDVFMDKIMNLHRGQPTIQPYTNEPLKRGADVAFSHMYPPIYVVLI